MINFGLKRHLSFGLIFVLVLSQINCQVVLDANKPGPNGKICCQAVTASCEACKAGQTIDQFCKLKPITDGCIKQIKPCCLAMTAQCLACQKSQSVADYCKANPKTDGCEKPKPRICC